MNVYDVSEFLMSNPAITFNADAFKQYMEFVSDFDLYGDLVIKYEKSQAIPLSIDEDCVILREKIKTDEYFYKCIQCEKYIGFS